MEYLNEFNDELFKEEGLDAENSKEDGTGSWDDSPEIQDEDAPGPEQDEDSVLNADVVLAEPGLKQDIVHSEIEEEDVEQKNTPQEDSRRVLSFNDFFNSSR